MPKPDDRSDNVERIADAIQNTMANLRETRDFLKAHGEQMRPGDKAALEAKNERREAAIEGFHEEIQDESAFQRRT
ncbi:small acid-soluble spore protein Tlp [Alicyclobacillus macrosporangiidus]|jgi:small acid-soluble spore protein (thioredoxin-like protein)|uniref:Small acid-soluble spore protein (Thioredoxin-like protein) n=1 Tax=Alicyclobacillus macrosporangiidus TaxID=392015 RepID=A0A1I7FA36_9BACL|nr:small acid-soluble spore protein Tlp [Alicyclobacillus macrosporangiidus]SFU33068.1 small acid-soluble spore protein (thioredoxin-like protein) [Alicyclobacillus macrosporangiidus]